MGQKISTWALRSNAGEIILLEVQDADACNVLCKGHDFNLYCVCFERDQLCTCTVNVCSNLASICSREENCTLYSIDSRHFSACFNRTLIQKKTCQAEKNRGNAAVWLCCDWVFCHCWKRTFSVSEASCFQDIGSSYVKFWMILLQLCSLRFLRRGKKFNEFLELLEEVHGKPE